MYHSQHHQRKQDVEISRLQQQNVESFHRRSQQHKRNYKKHKNNRLNGIFQIPTSTTNASNEMTESIGIYELTSSEAKETFGEEGACFFVVANAPQDRSRVVSTFIEENIPSNSTNTSSEPHSFTRTNSHLCVETNDHSISSGVGSGESSELDSPNPVSSEMSCLRQRSCSNYTDRSTFIDNCSCPSQTKTFHNQTSISNDSGFYSTNSSVAQSPLSPTKFSMQPLQQERETDRQIDERKEILLCRIKSELLYDPKKEELIEHLKQLLTDSGYESFREQLSGELEWRPLLERRHENQIMMLPPFRSALKKTKLTLLEEIQAKHALKSMQAKQEPRIPCSLKRSEVVKIIQQVRSCLRFTQKPFQYKFQVHRKIKLKTFSPFDKETTTVNAQEQEQKTVHMTLCCKKLKDASGKGNIKRILNLLNANSCQHVNGNECLNVPAFHDAFQKQHYRTAILLLEAGTDLQKYTEQRISEFNRMQDIVQKNKNVFNL